MAVTTKAASILPPQPPITVAWRQTKQQAAAETSGAPLMVFTLPLEASTCMARLIRYKKKVFFICDEPDLSSSLIEAVQQELLEKFDKCNAVVHKLPSGRMRLRMVAATDGSVQDMLKAAQLHASDLMEEQPAATSGVFLCSPNGGTGGTDVVLQFGRVKIATQSQPRESQARMVGDKASFHRRLHWGLKKIGRLDAQLRLSVHFGHFKLLSYPQGGFRMSIERFAGMLRQPRTKGRLETK